MSNGPLRWTSACLVVLAIGAAIGTAHAARRGGGAGGERAPAGARLCSGWSVFYLKLTDLDLTARLDESQQSSLRELKDLVFKNSEEIQRLCGKMGPLRFPEQIDASQARLEAMLTEAQRTRPLAEKFYATLSDAQKAKMDVGDARRGL